MCIIATRISPIVLVVVVISGCGGGSLPGRPISVSISPSSSNVPTSQTRTFTATVRNDASASGVTWELSANGCPKVIAPVDSCGVLSNVTATTANYTAPDTVPLPAGITLTARAVADRTKTATANFSVFAAGTISISISPSSPTVETGKTIQLTATVVNDPSNAGVMWSITAQSDYCSSFPCGSLSPTSSESEQPTTYSAPSHIVGPGPALSITATSLTDPTVSASVRMRITCATSSDCIP
jgi:hypothetical protein